MGSWLQQQKHWEFLSVVERGFPWGGYFSRKCEYLHDLAEHGDKDVACPHLTKHWRSV